MNEEKMTLKKSVRLTLRAWRFYWKNTPRFVLSTVLWALADAVSPYAVVWFSARLVAELSDARDPQALAVDVAWAGRDRSAHAGAVGPAPLEERGAGTAELAAGP